MAGNSFISMAAIMEFFGDTKIIRRGENSVASGFVQKVLYDDDLQVIRGTVHASMKQKLYNVEIFLSETDIQRASCNCPKGLLFCHHMAALAIFAHKNLSVTDRACQWSRSKVKSTEDDIALTAEACFASSSSSFSPLLKEISEDSVERFKSNLKSCGPTGLGWLMSPEPTVNEESLIIDVEQLLFSEEFVKHENKMEYLREQLVLTKDRIILIEKMTKGQSNNPAWHVVRKHRLTASNFGRVLKACKRGRFPPSLFQTLTGNTNLDGIKQIQWGRSKETDAIRKYEEKHNSIVTNTGIWFHECGFLGASPDGMINDCIIEVKCPFKYRDSVSSECLLNNKDYIVTFDGDKFIVNVEHDYYSQIQGQLHICKKKTCILIIWGTKDYVEIPIEISAEWESNINILQEFYLNKYIQYILN